MKNFQHLYLETDSDDVLWLTLDVQNDDFNTLSTAVLLELSHACMQARLHQPAGLILRSAKPDYFSIGISPALLSTLPTPAQALEYSQLGQSVCQQFADLPFPTLALIDGVCTGGGLELVLALDYRISSDNATTQLGLTDIHLGLHPSFGSSVRCMDKLGIQRAMELILSGDLHSPQSAKQVGIVDSIVPPPEFPIIALQLIHSPPRRSASFSLFKLLSHFSPFRKFLGKKLRCQLDAHTTSNAHHYPAPYALIALWEQYGEQSEQMYDAEAASFAQLLFTPTAQNLIRAAQLQYRLQTFGQASAFSLQPPTIKHVHIVGHNTTSHELAACCQQQGWQVTLQTPSTPAPQAIQQADVIIEAISDNLAAKQQMCAEIEPLAKPTAILITLTVSSPIEDIAAYMKQPQRLLGLHFIAPLLASNLVEVVFDPHDLNQAYLSQVCYFVTRLQKLPLPIKSSPGLLINRVLLAYIAEGIRLHLQGIPAAIIDQAARDFGMRLGPLELADTLGIAFCQKIGEVLERKLRIELPLTFYHMIREGRLGKTAGHGFYKYRKGKVFSLHKETWHGNHTLLQERLIQQMIHSAQACLAENIVADADLLDAGMMFGAGFAPFRGGPLHYAKTAR